MTPAAGKWKPEKTWPGVRSPVMRTGSTVWPKRLVTSSVVRPENTRYIVNQPLVVPVRAGDMLLWSQFEQMKKKGN